MVDSGPPADERGGSRNKRNASDESIDQIKNKHRQSLMEPRHSHSHGENTDESQAERVKFERGSFDKVKISKERGIP